eukprot:8308746-Pyramimonas_sp.AAC.1
MDIDAADGIAHVRPGSGVLQGDTYSAEMFSEVHHPQLDAWDSAVRQPPLQARHPYIPDRTRNLAMTSYADDVARKIICGSFHNYRSTMDRINNAFDTAITPPCQNRDKQEHDSYGCHSHQQMHRAFKRQELPGITTPAARYPGGRTSCSGDRKPTIDHNCAQAYKARCRFRRV